MIVTIIFITSLLFLLHLYACFSHCVLFIVVLLVSDKGSKILIWVFVRCIETCILSEITGSSLIQVYVGSITKYMDAHRFRSSQRQNKLLRKMPAWIHLSFLLPLKVCPSLGFCWCFFSSFREKHQMILLANSRTPAATAADIWITTNENCFYSCSF